MTLAADKLLSALAMPLGSSLALALLALVALAAGWRRLAGCGVAVAVGWLWICATPAFAGLLSASLESAFPPLRAEDLPQADAIVLLGGGISPSGDPDAYPDLGAAADRIWHAARLQRTGRAPLIIAAGGNVWPGAPSTEADAMTAFLGDLGVPAAAILLDPESRNTRQNAVNTAQLLADRGLERILLVTSAWHMPRALACFRVLGIDAVAAATDHTIRSDAPLLLRLLPDALALATSSMLLKEYLGLAVYRFRGWA